LHFPIAAFTKIDITSQILISDTIISEASPAPTKTIRKFSDYLLGGGGKDSETAPLLVQSANATVITLNMTTGNHTRFALRPNKQSQSLRMVRLEVDLLYSLNGQGMPTSIDNAALKVSASLAGPTYLIGSFF
jgi:hypothetical protein